MNPLTLTGIVIAACAALLAGMAALIKTMLLKKLDEIAATVNGLSHDMHRMDIRLTRLEAEHKMRCCGGE